jgi:hypothetical protein
MGKGRRLWEPVIDGTAWERKIKENNELEIGNRGMWLGIEPSG